MHVRYFEKRGNTWADFRLPGGERKRMDTGAPWGDRKAAERAMPGLIARAMGAVAVGVDPASGTITKAVTSATREASGPTMREAFKHGLRVRGGWAQSKAQHTLDQTFGAIIDSTPKLTEDTPVAILTRDFVRELRATWMKEEGKRKGTTLSASTINHRLSMLSVLLEVSDLPPHTVKHLSTKGNRRTRRITDTEIDTMRSWCYAHAERKGALDLAALITVGIDTGARQGELLALQWRDVAADTLTFRDTKNSLSRTIPLRPAAKAILEARRGLPSPFGMLDSDRIKNLWVDMREALGKADDPEFVFHALRHESVSRMVDEGKNTFAIAAYHGHENINTTQGYAKVSLAAMREAAGVQQQGAAA